VRSLEEWGLDLEQERNEQLAVTLQLELLLLIGNQGIVYLICAFIYKTNVTYSQLQSRILILKRAATKKSLTAAP
jgi:hypothetical protein